MRRRLRFWLILFGCWTVVGLISASQWYLSSAVVGPPVTWAYVLTWVLADSYVWAALSAVVLALARRFPVKPESLGAAVPLHLAASVVLALVHGLAFALVAWWAPASHLPDMSFAEICYALTLKKSLTNVVTYWVVLGLAILIDERERYRERELRASQLEGQLAGAQLEALRAQLHPHFLFNALNAVSEMIHTDARAADRMVARLGDMLRASLDAGAVDEVPLRRELELVERYLEIERMRFRDRLSVTLTADPACLDAPVPNFILQPLVENAIRHGVSARPGAGRVEVEAVREGGMLIVRVTDDGPGIAADSKGGGIGLANTRRRLERLYPGRCRLDLRNVTGGGLEVSLAIPLAIPLAAGAAPRGEA
jgi:two-component system LytT family sensor kinase